MGSPKSNKFTSLIATYNFKSGITRNIILLGLVSLCTDMSSQMVFPLIPLYMTSVLGSGALAVAIVEGAAESTASFLKVFSGYWSDKIKRRKPFVVAGYSISSFTKPLFSFANVWGWVLIIRVIERVGKGIRTAPRDAIIAESVERCDMGKAYGFHRAMDGVGSVIGALLAFTLLPVLGYKNIFLFSFIPAILAVFALLFIKEKKEATCKSFTKEQTLKVSLRALPRDLKLFILVSSIFSMGHFGYAFLLLRAKNIGLSDETAILFYALFYVVYVLWALISGTVSDRIGRRPVLLTGYALFAGISLLMIASSRLIEMMLIFILYGIFYAMIDVSQRAYVVDLAPSHLKATALGTFHTAIGLVTLPGGIIAGMLWERISPETTFIYGLVMSVMAIALFMLVKGNATRVAD